MPAPLNERRAETPRALLAAWHDRTGLPPQILAGLPPIVALFAVEGQPAFGVAVLARLSGSTRALFKMRDFEGAADEALRELGFRLDLGATNASAPEQLADRVELLCSTLSSGQVDQLGVLFEDYMRSTEAEWLELVLRAVRAVVKDAVGEGTRRSIIARLPSLSAAHLRELARLRDRPERLRGRLGVRVRESSPLQTVLIQVGFIREGDEVTRPVEPGRGLETLRPPDGELKPTALGLAALKLFGPIDVTEARA